MPFKPLSNALLNPHKAPFGTQLYNYLITKNLRRLLNNSSFHPFPHVFFAFLSIYFEGWWMLGAGCWVVGVNGFYKVHCKSTHHHHPTFNTQHSTFNPTHHQHPTFITQHHTSSSPNIQSLISSTLNIHHPTPNIQSHTSSTPNIHHPTPNIHHPSPNISHPINFIISFFLCKFAVK